MRKVRNTIVETLSDHAKFKIRRVVAGAVSARPAAFFHLGKLQLSHGSGHCSHT